MSTGECRVVESIDRELKESGYLLDDVRCQCDGRQVTLSGSVSRFYHVQVVIEAARRFADGRHINIEIEVVPTSTVPAVGMSG